MPFEKINPQTDFAKMEESILSNFGKTKTMNMGWQRVKL